MHGARVVHGFALLLVVAIASVAGTGRLVLAPRGHDRGACHQWVAGPTRVVACDDGHSYDQYGHDLGPNTPGGQLPRG